MFHSGSFRLRSCQRNEVREAKLFFRAKTIVGIQGVKFAHVQRRRVFSCVANTTLERPLPFSKMSGRMAVSTSLDTFTMTLGDNQVIKCDTSRTILDNILHAGMTTNYSCLAARCKTCKVKVLHGSYVLKQPEGVLSEVERQDGYVLSCNTYPRSNIVLDVAPLEDFIRHEPRIVPAKISELELHTENLLTLKLRFPPNQHIQFVPGQYVNIIKGGVRRSYSIAGVSLAGEFLFVIRNHKNGQMSSYLFEHAKINDLCQVEGPYGTFYLRSTKNVKEVFFIVTGTGIAPVKAILEAMVAGHSFGGGVKYFLIWGNRMPDEFIWYPAPMFPIKFIPVLSRPNDNWTGKVGYVQDVLGDLIKDKAIRQFYLCGNLKMIDDVVAFVTHAGYSRKDCFVDAFLPS